MVFHIKQSIKRLNEKKEAEEKAQTEISELQDALCEIDEANAVHFAAIEDALCDIDAGTN